jgi:acyl-CoA thioesterase FadM
VMVDRKTRKSTPLNREMRGALAALEA